MTPPSSTPGVSRRAFLAATTLAVAGCGRLRPSDTFDCDVCIVGSGFAGMFLATRLVERGLRVVMLEAGPRLEPTAPATGAVSLFPSSSTGSYAFPVDGSRTVAVGGTSRQWNGVVSRLWPADLTMRSVRGLDVDWPLAYAELERYYCEAEAAMGVTGGPFITGAEPPRCAYPSEQERYDGPGALLGLERPGFFPMAFALVNTRPLRVDEGPLQHLQASPRFALLENHPVTGLSLRQDGTVTDVGARRPDGTRQHVRARAVVVAAGVVESTRLLLLAREAHGIRIGGDRLGLGFNAHPRYRVQVRPRAGLPALPRIHRSFVGGPETFQGRGAYVADVQFQAGPPLVDVTLELQPSSANRLSLDPGLRDTWGRPVLRLDANWTERDTNTRTAALATQADLAARLGTPPPGPTLRWFHPAGSCAMGHDARTGVVDSDLKTFGTSNLYVAGAAAFPTAGTANPTLTIVALALRLGDHLATTLRG